jgi:hypothetical protein
LIAFDTLYIYQIDKHLSRSFLKIFFQWGKGFGEDKRNERLIFLVEEVRE